MKTEIVNGMGGKKMETEEEEMEEEEEQGE